jgi:hypothetical protein
MGIGNTDYADLSKRFHRFSGFLLKKKKTGGNLGVEKKATGNINRG